VAFTDPHDAATAVLAQGMMDLGLIPRQSMESLMASGDYKRFYMHRTGHWLGLDVHDVGDYTTPLCEGMVMTVEPGLYIRPSDDIPQAFWNIGIRIEDDVMLGAQGPEILTRGVPAEAQAIEALMQESR
jgi:Xaa-Pro aminopeptidase